MVERNMGVIRCCSGIGAREDHPPPPRGNPSPARARSESHRGAQVARAGEDVRARVLALEAKVARGRISGAPFANAPRKAAGTGQARASVARAARRCDGRARE
jgi:hypothetical protein